MGAVQDYVEEFDHERRIRPVGISGGALAPRPDQEGRGSAWADLVRAAATQAKVSCPASEWLRFGAVRKGAGFAGDAAPWPDAGGSPIGAVTVVPALRCISGDAN